MTTSAQATTAMAADEPLPLVDLAAFLRAASAVCKGSEGDDHNILTATAVVADRVKFRDGFPELLGLDLGDDARLQVAAALCRAVYGRVPENPVLAAIRWQLTIDTDSAVTLGRMLDTAASQVVMEAANARASALLGVSAAVLDDVAERA